MIKRPDEYAHNNPDYAIADSHSVRGGGRVVANMAALYAIPTDLLKQHVTEVWVTSEGAPYRLVDITNKGQSSGWVKDASYVGKTITNVSYNADNGTLTFTFNDNSTYVTGDIRGEAGVSGINYLGDYSAATTYNHRDCVISAVDGNNYFCKVDNVVDKEPSANPTEWALFILRGAPGAAGKKVLLQKSPTHVEWQHEGDATWTPLVPIADITGADGREVELRTTATHLQWRLADGVWADLLSLNTLQGNVLMAENITLNIPGRTLGKYNHGDTIQCAGKTVEATLRDIAIQATAPSNTLSVSITHVNGSVATSIPFNQKNPTISFVAVFNSTVTGGASIASMKLEYRRGNGAWTTTSFDMSDAGDNCLVDISGVSGTYNTDRYQFKFTAVASNGLSTETYVERTPTAYAPPTISQINTIVATREIGDVSSTLRYTVAQSAQSGVLIVDKKYQLWNGTAWVDVADITGANQAHNSAALKDNLQIKYRGYVVSSIDNANQSPVYSAETIISLSYHRYIGSGSAVPTGADNAARRTAIIGYNPTATAIAAGEFNYNTGSTNKTFFLCLPPGLVVDSVLDTTANANISFTTVSNYEMNDAGGNPRIYKMYSLTLGAAYSSTHNWRIKYKLG